MIVLYTIVGQQVQSSAESRGQEGTYVLHSNLATGKIAETIVDTVNAD